MAELVPNPHRQKQNYWAQLYELKTACAYMRRYRAYLNGWVTSIDTIKAVASSASIAAWALWREHAFIWASIIAASQVLEALKDVFPMTKKLKAASEHTIQLESLFIDAQVEWENIFTGHYADDEIMGRWHKLMKLQHDAETKNFPNGLPFRPVDFSEAEAEARDYFRRVAGVQKYEEGGV
jgi:hypothetical protein